VDIYRNIADGAENPFEISLRERNISVSLKACNAFGGKGQLPYARPLVVLRKLSLKAVCVGG